MAYDLREGTQSSQTNFTEARGLCEFQKVKIIKIEISMKVDELCLDAATG